MISKFEKRILSVALSGIMVLSTVMTGTINVQADEGLPKQADTVIQEETQLKDQEEKLDGNSGLQNEDVEKQKETGELKIQDEEAASDSLEINETQNSDSINVETLPKSDSIDAETLPESDSIDVETLPESEQKVLTEVSEQTSTDPSLFKYSYNEDLNMCTITDYTGTEKNVIIPSELDGHKVNHIGREAFYYSNMESVVIPEGVLDIDLEAFRSCKYLKTIQFPSTLISIFSKAFYGCTSLKSITLPKNLETFDYDALQGCSSLAEINVEEGNQQFCSENGVLYTFDKSTLIKMGPQNKTSIVDVPKNTTKIVSKAFESCIYLKKIVIAGEITDIPYDTFYQCENLEEVHLPDTVTNIAYQAFSCCTKLKNINIPTGLKVLENEAFAECSSLISITLPKGLTVIPERAFVNCSSLEKVDILGDVTDIRGLAFYGCEKLQSIVLPVSVINIGSSAFSGCQNFKKIIIPQNVKSIGSHAFSRCVNLSDITISEGLEVISYGMFMDCVGLEKLVLPDSITTIEREAFGYCTNLKSINIPKNVSVIEEGAFESCYALNEINVDPANTVFSNQEGVLFGDNNTSIIKCNKSKKGEYNIPNGVTKIYESAFSNCTGLTKITMPDTVTFLSSQVFENCTALQNIKLSKNIETMHGGCFKNCINLESIILPEQLTSISWGLFKNCKKLSTIDIPSVVDSISSDAFLGCDNLVAINIDPKNVSYSSADGVLFNKDQTKLMVYPAKKAGSYVIPDSVTTMEMDTFTGCSELTEVSIPSGINSLWMPFYNCKKLKSISVSADNPNFSSKDGVLYNKDFTLILKYPSAKQGQYTFEKQTTDIQAGAFSECYDLKNIVLPEGLKSIYRYTFKNCKNLTEVTIPNSVTWIQYEAFTNCGLKEVELPSELTFVGDEAFADNQISKINIPEKVTEVGKYAFGYVSTPGTDGTYEKIPGFVVCGKKGTEAERYAVDNGFKFEEAKPELPKFELPGSSMVLGNNLNFESYIPTDQLSGRTDVYALVTKHYADGRANVTQQIPYSEWKDGSEPGLKFVEFKGISAKEMMDTVSVQVFDNNDQAISKEKVDSIHDYALRMLQDETSTAALKTVLVDMLNYGAACQTYFKYDASNLANNDIDAYQQFATKDVISKNNVIKDKNYAGTSLITKSNIRMIMYFKNLTPDMHAVVTFKNHRGKDMSFTVAGDKFDNYKGLYGVAVDTLAVADVNQMVTCEIYDSNNKLVSSASDSIESYVARMSKGSPVFDSIMKFGTSAYGYFHNK